MLFLSLQALTLKLISCKLYFYTGFKDTEFKEGVDLYIIADECFERFKLNKTVPIKITTDPDLKEKLVFDDKKYEITLLKTSEKKFLYRIKLSTNPDVLKNCFSLYFSYKNEFEFQLNTPNLLTSLKINFEDSNWLEVVNPDTFVIKFRENISYAFIRRDYFEEDESEMNKVRKINDVILNNKLTLFFKDLQHREKAFDVIIFREHKLYLVPIKTFLIDEINSRRASLGMISN